MRHSEQRCQPRHVNPRIQVKYQVRADLFRDDGAVLTDPLADAPEGIPLLETSLDQELIIKGKLLIFSHGSSCSGRSNRWWTKTTIIMLFQKN